MKPHVQSLAAAGLLALFAFLSLTSACGSRQNGARTGAGSAPAQGTAVVFGTTVDARTGEPLAGVTVTGPGGLKAVSDAEGRFVISGLREGASGELVARSQDGRRAKNLLRPLRNERLEVVLRLSEGP